MGRLGRKEAAPCPLEAHTLGADGRGLGHPRPSGRRAQTPHSGPKTQAPTLWEGPLPAPPFSLPLPLRVSYRTMSARPRVALQDGRGVGPAPTPPCRRAGAPRGRRGGTRGGSRMQQAARRRRRTLWEGQERGPGVIGALRDGNAAEYQCSMEVSLDSRTGAAGERALKRWPNALQTRSDKTRYREGVCLRARESPVGVQPLQYALSRAPPRDGHCDLRDPQR